MAAVLGVVLVIIGMAIRAPMPAAAAPGKTTTESATH
jgi:hypothetical protein